jgi:hypothetical protein
MPSSGNRRLESQAGLRGAALVRVMAAPINPSDIKNVAEAMPQTTLPCIPGGISRARSTRRCRDLYPASLHIAGYRQPGTYI